MHGGKSTGAKTKEGIQRLRELHWEHGAYSQEQIAIRARLRQIQENNRVMLRRLEEIARLNPDALRRGGLDPKVVLNTKDCYSVIGEVND